MKDQRQPCQIRYELVNEIFVPLLNLQYLFLLPLLLQPHVLTPLQPTLP